MAGPVFYCLPGDFPASPLQEILFLTIYKTLGRKTEYRLRVFALYKAFYKVLVLSCRW